MSNNINVNVNMAGTPTFIVREQPGCLIQLLYFLFIGWWLGALSVGLAYVLFLTILGIPLGIMLINKLPYLLALRQTEPIVSYAGTPVVQHNFLARTLWFLLIGWWLTAIWLILAYVITCTLIGMPIGFWMFDRAPTLLTLRRR